MSKKSAKEYISANDFEGALERFNQTRSNWKQHWFDTCMEIAQNCKEWLKKYFLDPAHLTITAIIQKAKKISKKHTGTSHVYLIKMFDESGKYVFLKGGKADNVKSRLRDLGKYHYKRDDVQISNIEIIKTWELPTSHLAESFEQALHAYLCKFFDNIPNDRYYPQELTEEQFVELDRRHEIICSFAV